MTETRRTRIVCISDTHNQTPAIPAGDVLIHAGDLSNTGSISELRRAIKWLQRQKFECKIVVAGNHETTLDEEFYRTHGGSIHNTDVQDPAECIKLMREAEGILYLHHESASVQLQDPKGPQTAFTVFGSPYVPDCGPWGFCYKDPTTAKGLWNQIPAETDILITHTPPHTILDSPSKNGMSGCPQLLDAVQRIRPLLHVCGHIHEGRGVERRIWDGQVLTEAWEDPGVGSNAKLSLVDLTGRKGRRLNALPDFPNRSGEIADHSVGEGRLETCVVNAAIMAQSRRHGPMRLNKPIVVDIELPVWK